MLLFFDVETTGLPKRYNVPYHVLENWPRIVQIAWAGFTPDGTEHFADDAIIRPDDFVIPDNVAAIHGITQARALREGIPASAALDEFAADTGRSSLLVAHNISFDHPIVAAALLRHNISCDFADMQGFCTMKSREIIRFCNLPKSRGGLKWPKLAELHRILFEEDFENAHDARADVRATARCYFELKERGVI